MAAPTKSRQYRLGVWVWIALVVLTTVELPIAFRAEHPLFYLLLINVIDAWLILYYFMHLSQMWRPGE